MWFSITLSGFVIHADSNVFWRLHQSEMTTILTRLGESLDCFNLQLMKGAEVFHAVEFHNFLDIFVTMKREIWKRITHEVVFSILQIHANSVEVHDFWIFLDDCGTVPSKVDATLATWESIRSVIWFRFYKSSGNLTGRKLSEVNPSVLRKGFHQLEA